MNSVEQLIIQSFFVMVVVLVKQQLPYSIQFWFCLWFETEKLFVNIVNRIIHFKNSEKRSTLKADHWQRHCLPFESSESSPIL